MSAPTVETTVPQRRRIAVGRKVGRGPIVVQMSQADRDAHTDGLTGPELLHEIKLLFWDAIAFPGAHASDLSVPEIGQAARGARTVFATVTGVEYDELSSARRTYPASLATVAKQHVAAATTFGGVQ